MLSTPNTTEGGTVTGITLMNGATPIKAEMWAGRAGERDLIGRVIATDFGNHRFAVWTMASDDQGKTWECFWGHYVDSMEEANESYALKARS